MSYTAFYRYEADEELSYRTPVTFTYNADGIRTGKTTYGYGHKYYLDGTQVTAEMWTQNNVEYLLYYLYDENGAPIGMQYRTSNYASGVFDFFFFDKNLQGDVIGIYNADGEKICTYTYDAWGICNIALTSGTSSLERSIAVTYNPFRYRGYYYDTETGLYYLQSRYYNPEWGRFLNADSCLYSSMLGFNMFVYCNNNPVNYIDPYGDDATAVLEWWMAIGGAISLVDGPLPVIDIIVIGGAAIIYACNYDEINNYVQSTTDGIWNAAEEAPSSTSGEKEKTPEHSLPTEGEPNSDKELYDKDGLKQTRHYGSDGKDEYDIDYRHPDPKNTHQFPHRHNWDWSKNPPRSEPIEIFKEIVP